QSRGAGRGRGRQHTGGAAAARAGDARSALGGAAPSRAADADHATRPGARAEPDHWPRVDHAGQDILAPAPAAADAPLAVPAPHSRAPHRDGGPAGACAETPMTSLKGKTALITGATDGVGRVVADRLGQMSARAPGHGRDRTRGEQVVKEIEKAGGTAEFLSADLAALDDVRRLADDVRATTDRLDILINNAGIGSAGAARQTSADGHELRFAVNYLAGFLLTYLLLPLIRQSAPARIVNVAS